MAVQKRDSRLLIYEIWDFGRFSRQKMADCAHCLMANLHEDSLTPTTIEVFEMFNCIICGEHKSTVAHRWVRLEGTIE